ncbi:MAG: bacillithiol biosynthesis deacetylase BshB1 [Chitinophagales bacterium]|nr:bacillithiol biosynthesis deacetylase BshB1 [Bacteroidota bacterium]MCB9042995.1 bacillithiol biosynthesis deacetylase BshB1 [Chitinophagales bacterium]
MKKLDILAMGVHPDDVELGCAGTLLAQHALGKKCGIVDFTKGEMGTRGTPELRLKEAENAAKILQVEVRVNLEMEDVFFENSFENKQKVIQQIRYFQPDVVLINARHDRHPDHKRAADLANEACFLSGLTKIITLDAERKEQLPWRPRLVLHYIQDRWQNPDVVVDISDFMAQKMEAVKAFSSQFYNEESSEPETYISSRAFFDNLYTRAAEMGRACGFAYAEGFVSSKTLGVKDITHLY